MLEESHDQADRIEACLLHQEELIDRQVAGKQRTAAALA